jgi:hypothetical protein
MNRLIAGDSQALDFAGLLRRQVRRQHGLRRAEQVLVFVIVELARRKNFARNGRHRVVVTEHGTFELAPRDAALDQNFAIELSREFQSASKLIASLHL